MYRPAVGHDAGFAIGDDLVAVRGRDAGRSGRGCVGDVGDLRGVERDGTLRADVDGARRPLCRGLLGAGIGVVLVLPDDVGGLVDGALRLVVDEGHGGGATLAHAVAVGQDTG